MSMAKISMNINNKILNFLKQTLFHCNFKGENWKEVEKDVKQNKLIK